MPFLSKPWDWVSYPTTYINPYPGTYINPFTTTFNILGCGDVFDSFIYNTYRSSYKPSCPSNDELLLAVKERLESNTQQIEELSTELDSKNRKIYELELEMDAIKEKVCPHQLEEENKTQQSNTEVINVDTYESPTVETLFEPETYFKHPDASYLIGHEPEEQ